MGSYEQDIRDKINQKQELPKKINISILKYFWQASPYTRSKRDSIPKFLREIEVFKHLTDNELRVLSTFFHHRVFSKEELVFKQGSLGIGFYLVYSGHLEVILDDDYDHSSNNISPHSHILTLEKYDYFGELALLLENGVRNATVVTKSKCELLGIFKPDVDELINIHPIVATKLLQSISTIVAERIDLLTNEVKMLKYKIAQTGSEHEE